MLLTNWNNHLPIIYTLNIWHNAANEIRQNFQGNIIHPIYIYIIHDIVIYYEKKKKKIHSLTVNQYMLEI